MTVTSSSVSLDKQSISQQYEGSAFVNVNAKSHFIVKHGAL